MPTERMEEVEVVCPRHSAEGRGTCIGCGTDYTRRLPVKSGSLTSARLRLADAAVRKAEFFAKPMKLRSTKVFPGHEVDPAWQAEREAVDADYDAAVSAVIAFDGAALRTARGEG